MQYIKIHSLDNVAVALADLTEGTEVTFDNQSVTLRQSVGRGHKFALIPIAKGENVVKYGLPIGHALADSQFLHQLCGHAAEILLDFRSAYTIVSNIFRRQHYRTGHIHG